jgi:hypothetical protein
VSAQLVFACNLDGVTGAHDFIRDCLTLLQYLRSCTTEKPMSKIGKTLLVITSLTPVLATCAVNSLSHGHLLTGFLLLGAGGGLFLICYLLLLLCRKHLPIEPITTKKVKTADKEMLAFLFVYLLPLFAKDSIDFAGDLATAVFVITIMFLAIYHSNSFTFNPVLAFFCYHFYEVDNENGMTYILITKKTLLKPDNTLQVVGIASYIFLDAG